MDTETKVTINFLDKNPIGLKNYLQHRYAKEINQIMQRLTSYFNERVDIHYTFEDQEPVWSSDLDFYLADNKSKYPIANAGNRKLPVCFVINPPCYKKPNLDEWIIKDEGIYLVEPFKSKKLKWLYKKKVNTISWERLFKKSLEINLYD